MGEKKEILAALGDTLALAALKRIFAGCPGIGGLMERSTPAELLSFMQRTERRMLGVIFPQPWRDAEVCVQLDQLRLQKADVRHLYVQRAWAGCAAWWPPHVSIIASMNALGTDDREIGRAAAEGYQALFDECGDGKAQEKSPFDFDPALVDFDEARRRGDVGPSPISRVFRGIMDDLIRQGHVVVEGMNSAEFQTARQEYERRCADWANPPVSRPVWVHAAPTPEEVDSLEEAFSDGLDAVRFSSGELDGHVLDRSWWNRNCI